VASDSVERNGAAALRRAAPTLTAADRNQKEGR
jgi:hypothetical protein